MNKQEYEYELKVQRCQGQVKQFNDTVFSTPSESEPGHCHILTVVDGAVQSCTCLGWHYYRHCYHAKAVLRFIAAQEAIKSAEEMIAETAYIRVRDGGVVKASEQIRTRQRGEFSLMA